MPNPARASAFFDAGTGQKSEEHKAHEVPGKSRQDGRGEIDRQGDHEPFLASLPIGEIRKKKRAEDRTGQVGGRRKSDFRLCEVQCVRVGQRRAE